MTLLEFISYAKKFCIALVAALGVLSVALVDGSVSASEWIQIAIAFAGALGVYKARNQ